MSQKRIENNMMGFKNNDLIFEYCFPNGIDYIDALRSFLVEQSPLFFLFHK